MTRRFCMLLLSAVLCAAAAACNDDEGDATVEPKGEMQADSADGIG